MDKTYKGLKILSSLKNNKWKIGKTDAYINTIFSKVSALPPHVFDGFSLTTSQDKKISTVDFALMTYNMSPENQERLMTAYSIDAATLSNILKVADEIGEEIETQESEDLSPSHKPAVRYKTKATLNMDITNDIELLRRPKQNKSEEIGI